MHGNHTFCNDYGLSVVLNVFVFSNLDRLVWICYVVQFLKGYKVFSTKLTGVECERNLNLHFGICSSESKFIFHTFTINEKFHIFRLHHFPTFQCVLRTFYKTIQSDRINDSYLFSSHDWFFTSGFIRSSSMDSDFFLVFIYQCT